MKLASLMWVLLMAVWSSACLSEPAESAPVLAEAALESPENLAGHHGKKVSCGSCHTNGFDVDDNESAQNAACINCHGSLTQLAANDPRVVSPHRSHLGQISCTVCHHGHTPSQAYCAHCHWFDMTIPYQGIPAPGPIVTEGKPRVEAVTDVVVIGSGGAGLSAAITVHDFGAQVILLEKQPLTGGNTLLAAGGLNAADTRFQRALGITDSVALMEAETMAAGKYLNDPALVHVLAANSSRSVDWLTSLGVDLSDVGKLAGASVKRAHRPQGGLAIGAHLIDVLRQQAARRRIDLRVNSKVVKIVENARGQVVGVHVLGKNRGLYAIAAKAVVLAAGGFSANPERVAFYRPEFAGMTTSNQPGATGDGIDLGIALDGQLVDMQQIQIHPTLAAGTRTLITEAVRGNGGILVNREGLRFVNEMATRSLVSAAVLDQTGKTAFLVFDQWTRQSLAQTEGYFELGMVREGNTLEDLAAALGLPPAEFAATIGRYNQAYATAPDHVDPDFQRLIPHPVDTPAFYAIEVRPGVHYTMGGLKIDTRAQVIGTERSRIPGFFAAGEVTGGVHGADRLGGNSISETITFGRIAGKNAAVLVHELPRHRDAAGCSQADPFGPREP
jgi:fumarate reductase flavoprotein subunit